VNLADWAYSLGIHVTTAFRWWQEGTLPVSAQKAELLVVLSPDSAALGSGR
jgi:putative resolvase